MLSDGLNELLRRYIDAQVHNPEAGAFHHHGHQVLADVMQVALNGADEEYLGSLRLALGQQGLEYAQASVHRPGGNKYLGNVDLVLLEALGDDGHAGDEPLLDNLARSNTFGHCLFRQFLNRLGIALNQSFANLGEIRHVQLDLLCVYCVTLPACPLFVQ